MEYVYRTQGTCSTNIELNVEDGVVKEVAFWGGCYRKQDKGKGCKEQSGSSV